MSNLKTLLTWEKPSLAEISTKVTAAVCEGKAFNNDDAEVGETCSS